MKRKIALVLSALMLVGAVPVCAGDNVKVNVNGQEVVFADAQPVIINSRTMIPLRGVFEKLGYTIEWNGNTKAATLKGEEVVTITSGSNVFYADGEAEYSDVPAQIINNRLYLPLRAIGEAADMDVKWDAATKTAYIYDDDYMEKPINDEPVSTEEVKSAVDKFFTAEVLMAAAEEYEDCIEEKGYTVQQYVERAKALANEPTLGLDSELKQEFLTVLDKNSANPNALEAALEEFAEKASSKSDECYYHLAQTFYAAGQGFVDRMNAEIEKYAMEGDFPEMTAAEEYKAALDILDKALKSLKAENDKEKNALEVNRMILDKMSTLLDYAEKDSFGLEILGEVM